MESFLFDFFSMKSVTPKPSVWSYIQIRLRIAQRTPLLNKSLLRLLLSDYGYIWNPTLYSVSQSKLASDSDVLLGT